MGIWIWRLWWLWWMGIWWMVLKGYDWNDSCLIIRYDKFNCKYIKMTIWFWAYYKLFSWFIRIKIASKICLYLEILFCWIFFLSISDNLSVLNRRSVSFYKPISLINEIYSICLRFQGGISRYFFINSKSAKIFRNGVLFFGLSFRVLTIRSKNYPYFLS